VFTVSQHFPTLNLLSSPPFLVRITVSVWVTLYLLTPTAWAEFEDITAGSGITYIHSSGDARIPDEGGACAVDLNQDGWTDLIFARFGDSILALINNQDGTFRDATSELGLTSFRDIAAIAAGDLDNDGDPDLILGPTDATEVALVEMYLVP
jgi:hypothetical protein